MQISLIGKYKKIKKLNAEMYYFLEAISSGANDAL